MILLQLLSCNDRPIAQIDDEMNGGLMACELDLEEEMGEELPQEWMEVMECHKMKEMNSMNLMRSFDEPQQRPKIEDVEEHGLSIADVFCMLPNQQKYELDGANQDSQSMRDIQDLDTLPGCVGEGEKRLESY